MPPGRDVQLEITQAQAITLAAQVGPGATDDSVTRLTRMLPAQVPLGHVAATREVGPCRLKCRAMLENEMSKSLSR